MKKILFLIAIAGALAFMTGCEEDIKGPLFTDDGIPGPVTSPEVENLPGAAIITYTLPSDEDVLYVKAEYTLDNGKQVVTKSSSFLGYIRVEGFGSAKEHTVKLSAVDHAENVSSPVQVTISPLTPDVLSVRESIEMIPDFGGVQFRWQNPNNAALAYIILSEDSTGTLVPIETVYSGVTEGQYTIRGFEPEERDFAMILRDRWDNFSDTAKITVTPLYEEQLDKSKFNKIVLDGDNDMNAWEGRYEFAFDNLPGTFNHTWAGEGWPQLFTVDLGVVAKLSRVIILQRQGDFLYRHGNPRLLEIWGMKETPNPDGSFDNWIKLKDAVARRPTLEGGTAAEDQEHAASGDEYSFSLDDPEVRYIRIVVNETWGLTGFIHMAEVTFYGQVVEEI